MLIILEAKHGDKKMANEVKDGAGIISYNRSG